MPAGDRPRRPRARWIGTLWLLLVYVIAAAPLVNVIALPEDFDQPAATRTDEDAESILLLRVRGVVVLGVMVGVAAWLLAVGRARPGAHALCAAGVAFSATPVLSGLLGLEPRLRGTLLILPATFAVAWLLPPIDPARIGWHVKRIALFYVYGTLALLAAAPSMVLESSYGEGWIGLPFRLHGLGLHSNGLAPFVVSYFLVRWFLERERGGRVHDLVALVVLVLTQSKMAWVMFLLLAALAFAHGERFRMPWVRWAVLALTLGLAAVMTDVGGGFMGRVAGVLPVASQSQAFSLTGRTQVWRETVYLWEQNPWFGYGPGLWDRDMQERYRDVLGWAPPQAHSQFYQSLGESGLVGVAGLSLYVFTLVAEALRLGRHAPIACGFVVVLVARGITEPTLSGNVDGAFVVHFWAIAFLAIARKRLRREAAP